MIDGVELGALFVGSLRHNEDAGSQESSNFNCLWNRHNNWPVWMFGEMSISKGLAHNLQLPAAGNAEQTFYAFGR